MGDNNKANSITVSNNQAKYYSDLAKGYADSCSKSANTIQNIYADVDGSLKNILENPDFISVTASLSDISAVADDLANIDLVSSKSEQITTLANSAVNIEGVFNNLENVNKIAPIAPDITACADNKANINKVGDNVLNIVTCAENEDDIKSVAVNIDDVKSCSQISDKITTCADSVNNMTSVLANIDNINKVAQNNNNITVCGTNITSIKTVAENIDNITNNAPTWGNIGGEISTQADLNNVLNLKADKIGLSTVATTGSYNDLSDKPVISNEYTLPTATTTTLGGVKVDGDTIIISNDGTISATSSGNDSSTTVQLATKFKGNMFTYIRHRQPNGLECIEVKYLRTMNVTNSGFASNLITLPFPFNPGGRPVKITPNPIYNFNSGTGKAILQAITNVFAVYNSHSGGYEIWHNGDLSTVASGVSARYDFEFEAELTSDPTITNASYKPTLYYGWYQDLASTVSNAPFQCVWTTTLTPSRLTPAYTDLAVNPKNVAEYNASEGYITTYYNGSSGSVNKWWRAPACDVYCSSPQ